MGLQYLISMNRQGKVRLAKWYQNYTHDEKYRINVDVHKLISSREHRQHSNFVELQDSKLVYKRYAGLFFIASIDLEDDELAYLSAIHLLVEVLDQHFENVCELDLVFNFYKVYECLDEIFLGGELQETSKEVILNRFDEIEALE
ncbi:Aps2p [Cyberlindnera jadinii NRRL Y-1542]|uniref:AP complex subunit sigma n=1 Tax=Cyberlindnera jadinii (strain ATCC 18201 / CBS 1600 / BCRC 20928 / JCM 3617 / NBRC 0987 / NRRL Y-1542) TaxID=983966 RepID=A0A1E4S2I7_CYBJN|nr:Adaptor protein complex sigma subunit [Cyberlindnera jadinii NRRL Y-1542]ODV73747.1 Adaptor protein complex sigma subunit [Cyberlindnera jadinii NRRL Y-1542]